MKTVLTASEYEIDKIKGSRFIGMVFPLPITDHYEELVNTVISRFPDARHWCWAYRGGDVDDLRWTDHGEPSGTAGRPILKVIDGLGLSHVLVVVVRYFGGTKLGTGGLARAYSKAAREVLDRSQITQMIQKVDLIICVHYSFEGTLKHMLRERDAVIQEAEYTDRVTLRVTLPMIALEELKDQVIDRTAGRARLEQSEVYWG